MSVLFGIIAPIMHLKTMRANRVKKFSEQLPDALDIMVRSLQAGHPISAAMSLVSKEMSDPIGTEFGIAVDEMTYGLDMRDALESMGRRMEVQDFQYVVVSINIQHETGGNLAEVLRNLSTVIRDRFRMFKKSAGAFVRRPHVGRRAFRSAVLCRRHYFQRQSAVLPPRGG